MEQNNEKLSTNPLFLFAVFLAVKIARAYSKLLESKKALKPIVEFFFFLGTATHGEKNYITFLFYVNNSSKEKSASAQSIKLLVYFL